MKKYHLLLKKHLPGFLKFCFALFFLSASFTRVSAQDSLPHLSFSPTTLSFSVTTEGSTSNQSSTLAVSDAGTPTVTLTKSTNSNWLLLPSAALGSLSFGINSTGLAPGTYSATVTAAATEYTSV